MHAAESNYTAPLACVYAPKKSFSAKKQNLLCMFQSGKHVQRTPICRPARSNFRVLKFHGGRLTQKSLCVTNRYYERTCHRAVGAVELQRSTWNLKTSIRFHPELEISTSLISRKAVNPYHACTHPSYHNRRLGAEKGGRHHFS